MEEIEALTEYLRFVVGLYSKPLPGMKPAKPPLKKADDGRLWRFQEQSLSTRLCARNRRPLHLFAAEGGGLSRPLRLSQVSSRIRWG